VIAAGVAGTLIAWQMPSEQAFAKSDCDLGKVAQVWNKPHNVKVGHGGFELASISQGGDHWQVVLSEAGGSDKPGFALAKQNGNIEYGIEYDSSHSKYGIPQEFGLRRAALVVANKDSAGDNAEWTLHLDGNGGNHFSATGDSSSIVYDASVGFETDIPGAKGVSARYALDAKRRAGAENILPSWFRHSAGLRYASAVGDLKVNLQQADPDDAQASLGYEAILDGDVPGASKYGAPHYTLKAAQEGGDSASYEAKVKLSGPKGLKGGLAMTSQNGKSTLSGHGEYEAKRAVASGIELGVDAKVTADSAADDKLSLQPIGLTANAELDKLVPGLADQGSSVGLRARYKLGAERPSLSATAKINNKRLAGLQLAAEGDIDTDGATSSKLRADLNAQNVAAHLETSASSSGVTRQSAQVLYPADLKHGSARGFGRLYQSSDEHDGKPRVQLGLQYDVDVSVAGKDLHVEGESAAFDTGDVLLGSDGKAWHSERLGRARKSASTLRKRVEGSTGEGNQWLRK